ncbi:MAG: hypothetical protein ABEJ84_00880, partial [Halodesulfurarchaeum sp.]
RGRGDREPGVTRDKGDREPGRNETAVNKTRERIGVSPFEVAENGRPAETGASNCYSGAVSEFESFSSLGSDSISGSKFAGTTVRCLIPAWVERAAITVGRMR